MTSEKAKSEVLQHRRGKASTRLSRGEGERMFQVNVGHSDKLYEDADGKETTKMHLPFMKLYLTPCSLDNFLGEAIERHYWPLGSKSSQAVVDATTPM